MRFAFSTLACPGWSIEQVTDAASDLGYDAVELRLLDGRLLDPQQDAGAIEDATHMLRGRGIEVCAFDSSCRVAADEGTDVLLAWIDLAGRLEVPVVRVFGGETPDGVNGEERAVGALTAVAPSAERAGVTVALETHDAFSSARRVAGVLDAVSSPAIGALWDSHHPYRVGESVDEVVRLLRGRIALVHVKDARRAGDGWELVLAGEGEVPLRAMLRALLHEGYAGTVSVEWEKRWHPEIADPEVALPQHIAWLRAALHEVAAEG